jgi:hypothetical protein
VRLCSLLCSLVLFVCVQKINSVSDFFEVFDRLLRLSFAVSLCLSGYVAPTSLDVVGRALPYVFNRDVLIAVGAQRSYIIIYSVSVREVCVSHA